MSSPEVEKLIELVKRHNVWRKKETINLIASENVTSPLVDALYLSDAMHRYAEGHPFKRYYQGTRIIDEIEVYCNEIISQLFNVKHVDCRPISGTTANGAAFYVLKGESRKSCIVPLPGGGHVSHSQYGIMGALGIEPIPLEFDVEEFNIDVDKSAKLIKEVKPDFIVLGASVIIFPHPVKEIKEAAQEVNAPVLFDAAHVLGLIAGKVYPDPFKEGADIVTTSTHKTFPGPQGGLIMTNDDAIYKKIRKTVFPVFVSNNHLHRLAATAATALEMKYFGEEYARQIVRNAKKFAESLAERGFKVLGEAKRYTETHQVLVDVRELGGGAYTAELLEKANIIVNKNMLPWDTPEMIKNPSGLRLGVQEMTRYGMKEGEMEVIADFFEKVLIDKEDPEKVREEVKEFRKEFTEIHYTFKTPPDLLKKIYLGI
ncbi:MAG TPA: serine hydroxymethyltransferase [Thermoproteales archaeon]|nr:serine hydroxymethyltransferase [Thermoproteales archaeon]